MADIRQIFVAVQQGDKARLLSLLPKNQVDIKNETTSILHASVEHNQGEILQFLLSKGVNLAAIDNNGATALHLTARLGRVQFCRLLLDRGAQVDARDVNGATSLHWACQYGQLEVCKVLCERGADIEARAKYDTTPLHIATRSEFTNIVKFLLDLKANTEVKTNKGLTPLHIAAMKGLATVAHTLLANRAQPNSYSVRKSTPLHFAAVQGDIPTVKVLCRYSANVNAVDMDQNTPASNATKGGHSYVTAFLARSGYPVFDLVDDPLAGIIMSWMDYAGLRNFSLTCRRFFNASQLVWKNRCTMFGCKALPNPRVTYSAHYSMVRQVIAYNRTDSSVPLQMEAALLGEISRIGIKNSQPVSVKPELSALALLDHGVDPNAKKRAAAVHVALHKRAYDLVHALVERGADLNAHLLGSGNTALHEPFVLNAPKPEKVINWIIGMGADPNVVNDIGDTPALHAAKQDQWKAAILLIKKGCDINKRNLAGEAIIHIAASAAHGGISQVHQLADLGVQIDLPGFAGNTALHVTAEEGQVDIMRALMESGASLDTVNTGGSTPLHLAVFHDQFQCMQQLLTSGANPNVRNQDGFTPYYFARLLGRTRILEYMQDKFSIHVSRENGFYLLSNDGER